MTTSNTSAATATATATATAAAKKKEKKATTATTDVDVAARANAHSRLGNIVSVSVSVWRMVSTGVLVAVSTAQAWAGTSVAELKPDEIAGFVAKQDKVVVLFTSPDPKCGYCVGADKRFAQGVAERGRKDWSYVLVQWAP